MPARINLKGQNFGRLTVEKRAPSRGRLTYWVCRCECGEVVEVMTQCLRNGATKSCGCYMREVSRGLGKRATTHGMRKAAEYSVWCGIKRRCENKNEKCYPRYGGKGIEVRFQSFEDFFAEVGFRPSAEHTIDRIDTSGHYECGNVRWATQKQQQRNRQNNLIVNYAGKSTCLAELCEEFNQPYHRVWSRIQRFGWSVEKALTTRVTR